MPPIVYSWFGKDHEKRVSEYCFLVFHGWFSGLFISLGGIMTSQKPCFCPHQPFVTGAPSLCAWGWNHGWNHVRSTIKKALRFCFVPSGSRTLSGSARVMFFSWRSGSRSSARSESMERSKQLPVLLRRAMAGHWKSVVGRTLSSPIACVFFQDPLKTEIFGSSFWHDSQRWWLFHYVFVILSP